MKRIGLTTDELLVATWSRRQRMRYAGEHAGLRVLIGETVALVGTGGESLLEAFASELGWARIDGAAAAAVGALRIAARGAVLAGAPGLVISDPFVALPPRARALAVADLAGIGGLPGAALVSMADPQVAVLAADRVVVVRDGCVQVGYPVVARLPRSPHEVAPVTERVLARLA